MQTSARCLTLIASCLLAAGPLVAQEPGPAHNVVLVTFDGLRWQELFRGIDAALAADPFQP